MLSHFECITCSSSVPLEEIKLIAMSTQCIRFFEIIYDVFQVLFNFIKVLFDWYDFISITITFGFNIIVATKFPTLTGLLV